MARGAGAQRRRWRFGWAAVLLLAALAGRRSGGLAAAEDKVGGELRAWASSQGAQVTMTPQGAREQY